LWVDLETVSSALNIFHHAFSQQLNFAAELSDFSTTAEYQILKNSPS